MAADHNSGMMKQTSKLGDTVVRFNGIWDGDILRVVTNEVIAKPKNIQWKPESSRCVLPRRGNAGRTSATAKGVCIPRNYLRHEHVDLTPNLSLITCCRIAFGHRASASRADRGDTRESNAGSGASGEAETKTNDRA
jgi:hypothetical protein